MERTTAKDPESRIEELESSFPTLSGAAFSAAAKRSLAAGQVIMHAENGTIFRVYPDGHREAAMTIERPLEMESGLKIRIR